MGYLEGLLGGFMGRKREFETEQLDEARRSQDREAQIFQALLASPDKETRDLATAGLLHSAQPRGRKGGLRGWLGELESSPYLQQIRDLPPEVAIEDEVTAGGGAPTAPASPASAISMPPTPGLAQSPTAATQVGAPPLTAIEPPPETREEAVMATTLQPPAPPPNPMQVAAPLISGRTSAPRTRPRQLFLTPEEETLRQYSARERGEILGVVDAYMAVGLSREEAVKRAIAERERARGGGATGMQSIAGEMPDGKPAFGVFDRATGKYLDPNSGQPLDGFRPRTTVGSKSYGATREAISMEAEFGGLPYSQQSPEMRTRIGQEVIRRGGEQAGAVTAGRAEASARAPLSTGDRAQYITQWSGDWQRASKSARDIHASAEKMRTSWRTIDRNNPKTIPPAAEAIIVLFERSLDPNSVVREAEARRPGTFQGLLTRIQGAYDRLRMGGATVPLDELESYVKLAESLDGTASSLMQAERQRIGALASDFGVEPTHIFGADVIGAPPSSPGTTPPRATVGAPPSAATGAPAPAGAAATGPGPDWMMVNGVLHYKGKPYQ